MGGDDNTEKTTIMVLNVDLQCPSCYKKVKKVLCKILQVRNQVHDEKTNTITISVVCCSPEKIRDKLCYKGGKAIKSIEIKQPVPPPAPDPKSPEDPKKRKDKLEGNLRVEPIPFRTYGKTSKDGAKDSRNLKDSKKLKEGTKGAMVVTPWAPDSMEIPQPPVGCGYGQCYHTGGPCYQYYGTPIPPTTYYGNYSYRYGPGPGPSGYGNGCYVYCDYFSEENASGCIIM